MTYLERVTWFLEGDGLEGQKLEGAAICKKGLASLVRYYNPVLWLHFSLLIRPA